jgi:hypothetical protein
MARVYGGFIDEMQAAVRVLRHVYASVALERLGAK